MRPLIRKLLPLVGLCWVGMAIAGDVENQALRCCVPGVSCPTEGGAAGRSGKFMRVSVKAVKDEVTGRVIEIPPTEAGYDKLLEEVLDWDDMSVFDALSARVSVNVKCEAGPSEVLFHHGSVICKPEKGATFKQRAPECTNPATGTTVILQIEYLSKDELLQELAENDAKIAQNNRRIAELDANIDKCDQRLNEQLFGNRGNHNSLGNSSTTETNSYENLPINNSSANWSWKHWLKHLPVSICGASGGDLGAWQNSGVGLAE